ncbi:uncharacterized protein LOC109836876 isoform X2 [Asparagus officinalis]|uniref:uncharacterized protein LOC109836876 isoform X2 n=1 Tax=Asparagus officinalis TaxID=4686 RepID=UPI00098DE230|nr:uncharacterized protein LOC109836876 isoform X2 [Asparagus officinalis]
MASAAAAIDRAASSMTIDESLWWDSFVSLFEELDAVPLPSDFPDHLVKKVKSNRGWFLDSVTRFRSPNQASKLALDSPKVSIGSLKLVVKPELKEAALRVSSCLCLDEVQSYILVNRFCELNDSVADFESPDFLHLVLLQYYYERQCLLKCIRCIFVRALCLSNESHASDPLVPEAKHLVRDGLESSLLSVLTDLLSSATSEKCEVDFTVLWLEESVIEDNLILDTLFLVYYDNFCSCSCEQWKRLCSVFRDMLSGNFSIGKLVVSLEARNSLGHAKSQLLLILIETLDLENLLRMVHDEVPFSQFCSILSLSDVLEMDLLVSSFSDLGAKEAGPLLLVWAVFVCLLLSLPGRTENNVLMEIDHIAYLRQAFEAAAFSHILDIVRGDALRDSDGPISGYLSVLRTVVSAFIASYELNHQAEGTLNIILDILSEIYHGEDSLSMQFWDRDSFVDGPIRSLLYMLEREYPLHTVKLVCLLSALCSGTWSSECVYNFLEKMSGITLLSEITDGSQVVDSCNIILAPNQLDIPSIEGLVIPKGTYGQILKVIGANTALVRWEFAHSGLFLLLLRLTQGSNSCSYEEISAILELLDRMLSSNVALSFKLLCFNKSVPVDAIQNNGMNKMDVRIDLVKTICTVALNFIQYVSDSHVVSTCIHILAEILKCAPCHVTEVVSRSNIFGTTNFDSSSTTWLLSGGLARALTADNEGNSDSPELTISVLNFTIQLVEKGGDDNLASALVVFSLQYVLVNHMHWKYKSKCARWKVTLKALDVMKSCIEVVKVDRKLGSTIRDILFFDSSIHNILCQIISVSPTELEKSNISRHYELKEIESLQLAICYGLDIVYSLLADFLKFQETFSKAPVFIQTMLSSTSKQIPIVEAAATWINFVHNSEIQMAAARVFSKLCVIASIVQPYKIENVTLVVDAIQIKELHKTILHIFIEELDKNEYLLTSMLELLTSAARYQPTILVSLMLIEEDMKATTTSSDNTKQQISLVPSVKSELINAESILDLILKFVKRFEILFESSPQLLLSILNLLKALWDGGVLYLHILEKIRSSEMFWKHISSILAVQVKINLSAKNMNVSDVQCVSCRYMCQGAVLDILSRELFLWEKTTLNETPEKETAFGNSKEHSENRSNTETSKSSDVSHPSEILPTCFVTSTIDNLIRAYSSSGCDKEIILRAKMAVCMCIVHLIVRLSTSNTGSLSISLVEKISAISNKLSKHPAFAALIAQYSSYGYSESKQLTHLILNDLYYHMQGELEGRHISLGPFQELSHFLLESETFQCKVCEYNEDGWLPANAVSMFDTTQVCSELGLQLWEHSGWKASIEVADRMLLHMHEANLVMSLSVSKYSALQSLVAIISMQNGKVSKIFDTEISRTFIEPCIRFTCERLQETEDSLIPALSPPEIVLKVLAGQAELLLSLSKILFRQNSERRKKYLPLSLLIIKTSGLGIRFLSDIRPLTEVLKKTMKFLFILLLTSMEFIYLKAHGENTSVVEIDQVAEASLTSIALLPMLCKYIEHTEFFDLSVASIDLMLKGFLGSNTSLPILESHLQLQHIIQRIQQKNAAFSIRITLNFLLTLAQTKTGAQMLYVGNIFSALKVLLSYSLGDNSFTNASNRSDVSVVINSDEIPMQLWVLCLAIITSMIHSLGDDPSCTDILDRAIHYFFYEKAYVVSHYLSVPSSPSDDDSKKRTQNQSTGTSLTSLKLTEQFLELVCVLAGHQSSWSKGMKEIDSELRETCIHLLAFISKGIQRIGDSSNKAMLLFCPPTLKEEIKLNERPSFSGSKQGWFRLCAIGLPGKIKASGVSSKDIALVTKYQANGNDLVHQTHFSDTVSVQIYRIAFLLLKFLCMQAKAAAQRAEELELLDLAYFPELPMPEIMHGLQDQVIAIVVEVCESHRQKSMQAETESLCLMLLQILEKSLYLELCVSQSCGIRPVLGRIEDFSKEIKLLMQVTEQHSNFKESLRSLYKIISLVYPGLARSGNPMKC